MKASELIKELQKIIKKYGDLDVKIYNPYCESLDDDFESINVAHIDFEDSETYTCEEHFVLEGI